MNGMPRSGADGVPAPGSAKTDYRAEGRPPTVSHDLPEEERKPKRHWGRKPHPERKTADEEPGH